jgi:hypothetical protein
MKLQVLIKLGQNSFNQEGEQCVPRATTFHSPFTVKECYCTPVYDKLVKVCNAHLTGPFLRNINEMLISMLFKLLTN